jgi:DNA-binding transcriptional MerR regulator
MESVLLPPSSIAALVPCSVHALLRAERIGTIPPALRTPGNHRRWSTSELETIQSALRCRVSQSSERGNAPSGHADAEVSA